MSRLYEINELILENAKQEICDSIYTSNIIDGSPISLNIIIFENLINEIFSKENVKNMTGLVNRMISNISDIDSLTAFNKMFKSASDDIKKLEGDTGKDLDLIDKNIEKDSGKRILRLYRFFNDCKMIGEILAPVIDTIETSVDDNRSEMSSPTGVIKMRRFVDLLNDNRTNSAAGKKTIQPVKLKSNIIQSISSGSSIDRSIASLPGAYEVFGSYMKVDINVVLDEILNSKFEDVIILSDMLKNLPDVKEIDANILDTVRNEGFSREKIGIDDDLEDYRRWLSMSGIRENINDTKRK